MNVLFSVCLENRLNTALVAVCTKSMAGFAACFRSLHHVSEGSRSTLGQAVALLLSVPCFRASHFFFKLAYALNQRHLLRLCGKDFFVEFYDHRLRTTLALIEYSGPPLFLKLKRLRPKLWQILVNREEFHATMEDADVALLKAARHQCCR